MFWGRALLDLEKPKNGFAGLLADFGFASWSYDRDLSFVDSALPGRAVFMPLWFLALIVVLPALIELIVVLMRRRPGPTTSGMSAG